LKTLIPQVDILKIDVEGHEFEVLIGAKKLLNKSSSLEILCEIWDNNLNYHKIIKYLESLNFELIRKINDNYIFKKLISTIKL